ncbi:DUF3263 domain-containing protein [Arthrobacter sp. Soil763]|uniref:DUF3263 domain-containing protein n=1 Tax=Arthrobacter sp. Soil763 TaxID=1736402 RepID=UPI0006FD3942|nr:DUF3263 domain-containing protein [Arthrobacter sp. Soil763]KRE79961.1 hypothetical protein ASG71_07965 [Arthrobacter sp. Soil763]
MLTTTEQAILQLTGQHFKYAGSLEEQAKERFGLSPTRYWQEVNRLIQTPAAHQHDPALANRLNQRRRPSQRLNTRLT